VRVALLENAKPIKNYLHTLEVDRGGIDIMEKKGELFIFSIKELDLRAAMILKQDVLALGGDFATPKDTIMLKNPFVDGVLITNKKQLELLIKKEKAQPFELKQLARILESHLYAKKYTNVKIMGVINANSDSFYSKSRFEGNKATEKIISMIEDGADIIDIGAVSSAPNTESVDEDEELRRLEPIFEAISKSDIAKKVTLSLDTFRGKVASQALDVGFEIINDITALSESTLGEAVAKKGATLVLMHMQGTPKTMQVSPSYNDVLDEISTFFEERCEKAKNLGIENIILDVGIGFGKRPEDNIALVKHLAHFRRFGYELLIGISRKSMIDKISPSPPEDRLAGTLALHLLSIQNGATIIRCHDVKEHKQMLRIYEAL